MIEVTHQEDGYQEILIETYEELCQITAEHGGDDQHDFFPGSVDPKGTDVIGTATCNDGTRILFYAASDEIAHRVYEQLF